VPSGPASSPPSTTDFFGLGARASLVRLPVAIFEHRKGPAPCRPFFRAVADPGFSEPRAAMR
ncbi:UNVERIFIED_CONTAM: hypothetical protein Q9R58_24050, partial [Methylobacteriaceae bacterium AG10]|nr:hypothetical protein [Methylobacteriaceae bacterium AG10]